MPHAAKDEELVTIDNAIDEIWKTLRLNKKKLVKDVHDNKYLAKVLHDHNMALREKEQEMADFLFAKEMLYKSCIQHASKQPCNAEQRMQIKKLLNKL